MEIDCVFQSQPGNSFFTHFAKASDIEPIFEWAMGKKMETIRILFRDFICEAMDNQCVLKRRGLICFCFLYLIESVVLFVLAESLFLHIPAKTKAVSLRPPTHFLIKVGRNFKNKMAAFFG
jgi:hypothetical protein